MSRRYADVFIRSGNRCERCGIYIRGAHSYHHRRPRGMGGTRDPLAQHPSNIVLLCGSGTTGCHGSIEANREDSYAVGWLLDQWTNGERTDPRTSPIWRLGPGWMFPGPKRWFAMVELVP